MSEHKLGVLGGMGPLATSVFFERLIHNTVANKDQDHIDMIILNHASLPDRTVAIIEGKEHAFLHTVKKDLEIFEMADVSNIVIPCNTSHYFYNEIQAMTKINIINMVENTIKYIAKKNESKSKVAILATDGTILSGVYEKECKKYNIEPYNPKKETQEKIMNIIYQVKSDADFETSELNEIIRDLIINENCSSVILGCTELSCVKLADDIERFCVDPMDILVEKAIILSGKIPISPRFNEIKIDRISTIK